jgi:hypothetical protein
MPHFWEDIFWGGGEVWTYFSSVTPTVKFCRQLTNFLNVICRQVAFFHQMDHQIATIDIQKVCQWAAKFSSWRDFDNTSNCHARKSGPICYKLTTGHSGGNDRFCARLKTDISASNSGLRCRTRSCLTFLERGCRDESIMVRHDLRWPWRPELKAEMSVFNLAQKRSFPPLCGHCIQNIYA